MSTYNSSSSYNRTYEKKVIEETPRVRMSSPFSTAIPTGINQSSVFAPSFGNFGISPNIPTSFAQSFSSLSVTDDSINLQIDVTQFKPEDLKVAVIGQFIIIEGKHGERTDEIGSIERSFTRRVALPRGVPPEAVTSNLNPDGILTIIALPPRAKESSPARAIPIKIVNSPSPASPAQAPPTPTANSQQSTNGVNQP